MYANHIRRRPALAISTLDRHVLLLKVEPKSLSQLDGPWRASNNQVEW